MNYTLRFAMTLNCPPPFPSLAMRVISPPPRQALYSLLSVGATYFALLVFGVAVAHSELNRSTTFGSAGTGGRPQGIGSPNNSLGTRDGRNVTFMTATPLVPLAPVVEGETRANVTATQATLQAIVNPEFADTHYFFEYGLTSAYGTRVPLAPGTDIGESASGQSASVELAGLAASTTYHFRVVATNSVGTTDGQGMTFMTATPLAPAVEGETTANITSQKATLQATVNPEFADTHYFFEYGPTTAYGTQGPLAPGTDIGESASGQSASVELAGLAASTTFHYRVVASNSAGTTDGPDQTFTTTPLALIESEFAMNVTATAADLRTEINPEGVETHYRFEYGTTPSYGTDAPVPDGTIGAVESKQGVAVHLEGLQPSTKYYFRVVATNTLGTVTGSADAFTTYPTGEQPSLLPDNRAYELVSPPDKNGGDVGGSSLGGLSAAWGDSSTSGSAVAYTSFTSFGAAQSATLVTQYLSSREPTGWTRQNISPKTNGIRDQNIQHGFHFFTPELTTAILNWEAAPLVPGAPEGNFEDLYVHKANTTAYELVTTVAPPKGVNDEVEFKAGSADLSHVVFNATAALTAGAPEGARSVYEWVAGSLRLVSVLPGPGNAAAASAGAGNGEGGVTSVQENAVSADGSRIFWTGNNEQLYVREDGTTTVKLNASQRTSSLGDGSALFRTATPDGSRVFFIDSTPLTNGPDDNGGLYEYDFSDGRLTDLSPDSGGSPEVEGVVGTSEDGRRVYFVAHASLGAGATAGANNLYLIRDGVTKFIAALSAEDSSDWTPVLGERTARVTPDGEHLAFVSHASLTGYDNIDLTTRSPDTEVFVYDAGTYKLSCASCNPSGLRPIGPAAVPVGAYIGHIPHYISDDGRRVFFDSKDALLPSDTNGLQNVYEYENGSVRMLSLGASEEDSTFADASANGDNVFLTTRAQLVPEDQDNSSDMYDVRVGGGFPPPAAPPPCTGEGCRGPMGGPPAPLSIATEASGTPEDLSGQPPRAIPTSHARPHKSKTRRGRRRSKAGKRGRKSTTGSRPARHRGANYPRGRRRGGRTS